MFCGLTAALTVGAEDEKGVLRAQRSLRHVRPASAERRYGRGNAVPGECQWLGNDVNVKDTDGAARHHGVRVAVALADTPDPFNEATPWSNGQAKLAF